VKASEYLAFPMTCIGLNPMLYHLTTAVNSTKLWWRELFDQQSLCKTSDVAIWQRSAR